METQLRLKSLGGMSVSQKNKERIGFEMFRCLESVVHAMAYLESFCLLWLYLGCLGSTLPVEREKFLECSYSLELLLELEEIVELAKYCLGFHQV
jgi:hypothetical protein